MDDFAELNQHPTPVTWTYTKVKWLAKFGTPPPHQLAASLWRLVLSTMMSPSKWGHLNRGNCAWEVARDLRAIEHTTLQQIPQLFLQQNPQYCLLYALGPTADFVIPVLKMSSAMVMPSGTPPTFCVKSGCPLLSTAKASNSQCTPR
jgi:hypothetical protein